MKKLITAASLFSVMALTASAQAQNVDVNGDTAGATALTERGVTKEGSNPTAGVATAAPAPLTVSAAPQDRDAHIIPKPTPKGGAGNMVRLNGDESADAPGADLKNVQGPDAQAVKSADATAHKTVFDPNDQLGTSTQGRIKPVPGASSDASTDTTPQQ